jgi:aspartate/methionine/tyrosine aminotransferase
MAEFSPHTAKRMDDIQPFHVMDLLAKARQLEAEGRHLIHMEIGEPDFDTPEPIANAAIHAIKQGQTHYTPAMGLFELRAAVSRFYHQNYNVEVDPRRIVITPGASGALQLALGVVINPGDKVIMADPNYPCNKHFVRLFEGNVINVPVDEQTNYQLTAELCEHYWGNTVKAVMLASPSNPTGTLIEETELQKILLLCHERGAHLIVDEIYHNLVYGAHPKTALAYSDKIFLINSFSKYFGMTGWRVGWLVIPTEYMHSIDKLAQNIFLAASTPAQYAALAAFEPETIKILEERRLAYQQRRDYLVPELIKLGFTVPQKPQGAFYIYAGCDKFTQDSYQWTYQLLDQAGVVITPGIDFGQYKANTHVRFAYTTSLDNLKEGVARLRRYFNS